MDTSVMVNPRCDINHLATPSLPATLFGTDLAVFTAKESAVQQ
jgi:hypothetical protein